MTTREDMTGRDRRRLIVVLVALVPLLIGVGLLDRYESPQPDPATARSESCERYASTMFVRDSDGWTLAYGRCVDVPGSR